MSAVRRTAARKAVQAKARAQRAEAQQLLSVARNLRVREKRGDKGAAQEIKERCASSLAFRRTWSALIAGSKRVTRGPQSGDFARGSRAVQGGRMNPR